MIIRSAQPNVSMTPVHDLGKTVPVTAKLSQKFYQKFGDELTNELVDWLNQVDAAYRSDLREMNELNFARFDAKLEQRIAEVRAEMQAGFGALRTDIATAKSETLKWFLLFWATTALGILLKS